MNMIETFVEDCEAAIARNPNKNKKVEWHGVEPGQVYRSRNTMRRCRVSWVANWTVGVKFHEESVNDQSFSIEVFKTLYIQV